MAKDKIADYDGATAGNNTDIGGISIAEGMLPSAVNNSMRELTRQLGAFADGTEGIDVLNLHDDDASASIKIQAPATVTTTTTFTLPDGDGTNGYALVTNGAGQLSWASAGGLANIVEDTTPQLGGNLDTNGNDINFGDNDKAVFGAGSDLQIEHDGTNSYITDVGTGDLFISGSTVKIRASVPGAEDGVTVTGDGAVTLYYDNAAKLATTSSGIDVTGNITVSGTVDGRDVASDGSKLDGIESGATADQSASEILTLIKTVDGAGSGLDADTLDGVSSASFLRSDAADTKTAGDLSFADNVKAVFGAGSDLQIYHNGTNSIIADVGTGDLVLAGDNMRLFNGSLTELYAKGVTNGAFTLYYDNAEKLATTSTGISVTGTVAATSYTGDGSSLTGIAAGATGGGSDEIFWENGQTVTTNYTISNGKNAMSAGPITINTGVTVTVGTGETWTVV